MTSTVNWRHGSFPKVTIGGTTYNHERFIARALQSAVEQDYPNFEVVMVDDGSTDGTADAAAPYRDRVRWIRKENGGVISAINTVYANAEGEFVTFCGGDDEIARDRIWAQLDYLLDHPEVGMVYSDAEVIDGDGESIMPSFIEAMSNCYASGRVLDELYRGNWIPAGGMMVRADLLEDIAPIPQHVGFEDWWLAVKVARLAEVHYVPGVVYRYRYHGDNVNLFAEGARQAAQIALEARLRQALLTTPDLAAAVSFDALAECCTRMVDAISRAECFGHDLKSMLELDPESAGQALQLAVDALRRRDDEVAIRESIRAFALDPRRADAADLVQTTHERSRLRQLPLGVETNGSVVAARAAELLAERTLLHRYAGRFDAEDDLTLVVVAHEEELGRVAALATECGLEDARAARVVVTARLAPELLAAHADAALGASWPALPTVDLAALTPAPRLKTRAAAPIT